MDTEITDSTAIERRRRWAGWWRPAALLGLGAVSIGCAALSIFAFELYGWGIFVMLPVAVGFAAPLVCALGRPTPTVGQCVTMAMWAAFLTASLFLLLGLEGLLCIAMALPLWLPLSLVGGLLAALAVRCIRAERRRTGLGVLLLATVPALIGAERLVRSEPTMFSVTTSVTIQAPPSRVWQDVVTFQQLPEPTDWLFRIGLAYPIRAEMQGRGTGAVRYCVFSTGQFVEPIEVWDEPDLLRFSVSDCPPPMEELSFYEHVRAPHLHGFFVSRRGQFKLTPVGGGGTLLEGTTWYQHQMWPESYWRLWSDFIIHRIHRRVLNHIKASVEREADA